LVVLNAVSASEHGARIATQTQCLAATRITLGGEALWQLSLLHKPTNSSDTVYAKALVNAGGPWVNDIFEETLKLQTPKNIRLIKGSHIVVPRIHNGDEAYILQNEDGRIVFVLPYEETFSLIGTTDVEFSGNPSSASLSDDELNYLLDVVNDHFIAKLSSQDVVSSFSGVRPLIDDASDDASEITRDYLIDLDAPNNQAPLVSIFGGKITTYRKLSEAAVDRLASFVPDIKPRWTANSCLPGGDFSNQEALINEMRQEYRWLTPSLARRYARTYGTLSHKFLSGTQCIEDMGEHFGAELYEREVEYLRTHEWACNAEDILWRRTKLGLLFTSAQVECLDTYLNKCRLAA
jgi:glycerol-3-phosphate dehydrogenase